MKAIVAIDIGTSSTRARLYRADDAAPLPGTTFSHKHEPHFTPDGGATLDPDALVRESLECARLAVAAAPSGTQVLGVGMSCFWHSVIGVDAQGRPQTPVLLWNDRRSAPQVARLKAERPYLPSQTGCPWHTSYVPGRLTWLAETQPAVAARCVRFLSPAAYLLATLFGFEEISESASMASASGLWDQQAAAWLPEWADRLPPVRAQVYHGPTLLGDLPWFPPLGDGACSSLGCGAATPDRLALMIGTSGAMRAVTARGSAIPNLPQGLWRYQLAPEWFMLGGALTNGGSVWAWLERVFRLSDDIEGAMAALPPDSHGLTVLPFLAGERAPLWRDDLTAALIGLSAATTTVEIARAHLEAVAYRFAALRERLRAVAPQAELIGTGAGVMSSPLWPQILADVLGETLYRADEEEASARGAALWAREGLGLGAVEDAPRPKILARFEPNPAHTAAYAAGRARHEALLERLLGD